MTSHSSVIIDIIPLRIDKIPRIFSFRIIRINGEKSTCQFFLFQFFSHCLYHFIMIFHSKRNRIRNRIRTSGLHRSSIFYLFYQIMNHFHLNFFFFLWCQRMHHHAACHAQCEYAQYNNATQSFITDFFHKSPFVFHTPK